MLDVALEHACPYVTVGYDLPDLHEQAKLLANKLHLVIDNHHLPRLQLTADKLVLLTNAFAPMFVDFNAIFANQGKALEKSRGLWRACKPANGLSIVDATAGWGKDAALMASWGAQVVMIERHPVMAALLADGLTRVSCDLTIPGSLTLIHEDAKAYLSHVSISHYPDMIYLDPMHPLRQKKALVKKEMQVLQQLLGPDEDVAELIEIAIHSARQRVIVKWPQRFAAIVPPQGSIMGKTVRFDLYQGLARKY